LVAKELVAVVFELKWVLDGIWSVQI